MRRLDQHGAGPQPHHAFGTGIAHIDGGGGIEHQQRAIGQHDLALLADAGAVVGQQRPGKALFARAAPGHVTERAGGCQQCHAAQPLAPAARLFGHAQCGRGDIGGHLQQSRAHRFDPLPRAPVVRVGCLPLAPCRAFGIGDGARAQARVPRHRFLADHGLVARRLRIGCGQTGVHGASR